MRAELVTKGLTLNAAQERAAAAPPGDTLLVSGPPGSGKTTALAAHAARLRASGRAALVICSHASGVGVFARSLQALGEAPPHVGGAIEVDTLCEHAAKWMRADYVAARVSPRLRVGDASATKDILREAGAGLLDMSWPLFARRQFNLDLPHLSRPEAFFAEAAALFRLLQCVRIGPDEFEAGCDAGLAAFYGENVERAVVLVQDPVVRERASQRGREACRAPATTLALQRAAERDVAAILAQLYREYLGVAAKADVRAPEDVVDAAIRWLTHDAPSAQRIARRYATVVIDDAEDGEPGLSALVTVLKDAGARGLLVAGWEAARVDGLQGRRSALGLVARAQRVELPPREPLAVVRQERAADEAAEVAWVAQQMSDLLGAGEEPAGIALLCRGEDTAAHYARQLRALGLPVALPGSAYEDEAALEDLLALCSLVDDAMQAGPLLRLLSSPVLGLSDATVWLLCRDAAASAQLALPGAEPPAGQHSPASGKALADNIVFGAADAVLSPEQRAKITSFRENLCRWCEQAAHLTPGQRLVHLAGAAGFAAQWRSAEPYRRERLFDDLRRLAEALNAVRAEGAIAFTHVAQRLQRGELATRRAAPSDRAIASASIACAKGERWRHVFIAGVAHERFPRIYTSHAIAFSRTFGLIVRENVARGAAQTAKFAWYYAKFGAKDMYLEEERRALDYGLSRATVSAAASGFGSPPRWAKQQDLLAQLGLH